jgi:hypothetical protein
MTGFAAACFVRRPGCSIEDHFGAVYPIIRPIYPERVALEHSRECFGLNNEQLSPEQARVEEPARDLHDASASAQ